MKPKLCLNFDTVMKILKEISQDDSYPMNNEIAKDYLQLLYTTHAIHQLFHSHNPFSIPNMS